MIGGFLGIGNNQSADWGENLLNTVASNTLRHLFTRSEAVDVEVRCNPSSKLLQGSIDSFKMSGRGLVIRSEFRTEAMSFETDAVSLDFGSVLQGKLNLKQPTQAIAQVELKQEDINQAFSAELVRKRLENLTQPALIELSDGDPVSFTDVSLDLLPNNRIKLFAKANLGKQGTVPVSLSCGLAIERRRRLLFNNYQFEADAVPADQRDTSAKLTATLVDILNNMIDLDRFNLDGVKLRLNRLETKGKTLVFSGYAQIYHVPKTNG